MNIKQEPALASFFAYLISLIALWSHYMSLMTLWFVDFKLVNCTDELKNTVDCVTCAYCAKYMLHGKQRTTQQRKQTQKDKVCKRVQFISIFEKV